MVKTSKLTNLKHALTYYAYLLVIWGFYRLLFQAPTPIEELVVKPLVWLLPLYFLIKNEKAKLSSLGITFHSFLKVAYWVLSLGVIFILFAIIVNYFKYNSPNFGSNISTQATWAALGLSIITAISEEVAFRGYLLTRLLENVKNTLNANLIISVGWALIHLPIAVFDWKLAPMELAVYSLIVFLFSLGATFVFLRTRNIIAPILLHVLWQWPIILFR